jgi:hypothetical protein
MLSLVQDAKLKELAIFFVPKMQKEGLHMAGLRAYLI